MAAWYERNVAAPHLPRLYDIDELVAVLQAAGSTPRRVVGRRALCPVPLAGQGDRGGLLD
jgi:hypothetical protein